MHPEFKLERYLKRRCKRFHLLKSISAGTQVSLSQVSRILAEFLADGLVEKATVQTGKAGQPAIAYRWRI